MKTIAGKVCIVIPAYNEGSVIAEVLAGLPRSVRHDKHNFSITIVVVNDGSSDETASEISKHPDVILINHIMNSGAGAATRTGLTYAKEQGFSCAITMDADGQHNADDAVRLIRRSLANDGDVIIGTRFKDTTGMPKRRIIGTKGINIITFLLFGVWVSDVQSGLKALNKRALETIRIRSNSFAFCSEIVWLAHMHKLRIIEEPIKVIYTEYSLAKGQLGQSDITAGVRFVRQLIKQRFMRWVDG